MQIDEIIREIKVRGLTGYKIAEDTGLSQVGVDKILNGTTLNPTKKTLEILHNYLYNNYTVKNKELLSVKNKGVPYYDVEFTASFVEVENSSANVPTSYIDHPFFKGCDYVVRNSGQSMAKLIAHGDAIGLVKINNWQDFFPLGEVYAIVTNNGFRMVKIITKGEKDDTFTLLSKPSDSKKDEFPPQQINKNTIIALYKVQASSHLF